MTHDWQQTEKHNQDKVRKNHVGRQRMLLPKKEGTMDKKTDSSQNQKKKRRP